MKLNLNSISPAVFKVSASETADGTQNRADIVASGRLLAYEYARKGANGVRAAMGIKENAGEQRLNETEYKELNEAFQASHLLYAANMADAMIGRKSPENFEEFRRQGQNYYRNGNFYQVLQGLYQEILVPILPRVYSEAVGVFADVVEVGFGETYALSIGSNDIPVFQDSAWGAARSVPRNRFYSKDYTLNPQPKTAQINAKWTQLVGTNTDFGQFFANISAGLYAKTMGMWNAAMSAAIADTAYVPSNLAVTFSNQNWMTLANRLAAVNNTQISNLIAHGNAVALSKVLPTQATGSTNVNMDAAIATLLGADYTRSGYLGEFMGIRLMPLVDAIVPGTQNTTVTTILPSDKVFVMASNGRKPLTIGYNRDTPITLEIDPSKAGDMEIGINMTIALDSVAVFESHIGVVTIS